MRFADVQCRRVYAIRPGTTGGFVAPEAIDPDALGELREGGSRWCGKDRQFFAIVASVTKGVTRQATPKTNKPR